MTYAQYPQALIDNVCFETFEKIPLYPTIYISSAREGYLIEPNYVSLIFDWYLGVQPTDHYTAAMTHAIKLLLSQTFLATRKFSTIFRYEKHSDFSDPPDSIFDRVDSITKEKNPDTRFLLHAQSSRDYVLNNPDAIVKQIAKVIDLQIKVCCSDNVRIELIRHREDFKLYIYRYKGELKHDETKSMVAAENKEDSVMTQRMTAHLDEKVPPGLAQWVGDQFDTQMRSGKLLDLYDRQLDKHKAALIELMSACIDADGKPKVPSEDVLRKVQIISKLIKPLKRLPTNPVAPYVEQAKINESGLVQIAIGQIHLFQDQVKNYLKNKHLENDVPEEVKQALQPIDQLRAEIDILRDINYKHANLRDFINSLRSTKTASSTPAHAENVDKTIIDVITNNFNEFVAECVDENGQPKVPSKKALMKARSMLPERCSMSLSKPKPTRD